MVFVFYGHGKVPRTRLVAAASWRTIMEHETINLCNSGSYDGCIWRNFRGGLRFFGVDPHCEKSIIRPAFPVLVNA